MDRLALDSISFLELGWTSSKLHDVQLLVVRCKTTPSMVPEFGLLPQMGPSLPFHCILPETRIYAIRMINYNVPLALAAKMGLRFNAHQTYRSWLDRIK